MRVLIACPDCHVQYDASDLPVGDRFRCHCGAAVRVREPRAGDAAVVRCSACGGARSQGAAACTFCGADFTLRERDLNTLCPECMTRTSDRARFCHHCGTGIAPQGRAGISTPLDCPACRGNRRLTHRSLGRPPVVFLECPRCGGVWLAREAFDSLLARARAKREDPRWPFPGPSSAAAPVAQPAAPPNQAVYRPCPACSKLMHRANYGRRSGVVIDHCKSHGIWLDASELEAILGWVRGGGEERARRAEEEEEQHKAALRQRFSVLPDSTDDVRARENAGVAEFLQVLGRLVGGLR